MSKVRVNCPVRKSIKQVASAIELHVHKRNNATARNVQYAIAAYNAELDAQEVRLLSVITIHHGVHA